MKCKDVSFSGNVLTEVVERRPNRDLKACELKSLFVFSICFGWSNDRYHLPLILPQRLCSGPALWTCNTR